MSAETALLCSILGGEKTFFPSFFLVCVRSFVRPFVRSCVFRVFVRAFFHSLRSFTPSFSHSFIFSLVDSFVLEYLVFFNQLVSCFMELLFLI